MKKMIFLIGIGLGMALGSHAQKPENHLRYTVDPGLPLEVGKGAVLAEPRPLEGELTEIVVGNGIQLYLTREPASGLIVEAQPNILPLVQTLQSGNQLIVRLSAGLETSEGVKIKIALGHLQKIHLKEGAYFEADSTLVMDELVLFFESGSQGKCDLNVQRFSGTVMGGSFVRLNGAVANGTIKVVGGSELAAEKLQLQAVGITVLGASSCVLSVEKSLQARVENESRLSYYGNPEQVATDTKLNGKIVRRRL